MWEQFWDGLVERFTAMSTRYDGSDAGMELWGILVIAFLLGFLFCYVQSKSRN